MIHILASFFDPGKDSFDIMDVSIVLGIIVAVTTLSAVGLKWLDGRITHRTREIQPGANGGRSLNDLHKKVDQFFDYQRQVNEARDQSIDLIITRLDAHDDLLRGRGGS